MVDLHSHILPMLDDGAGSFEESITMLEIADKWNIRHIVASSHGNEMYPYRISQYKEAFARLQTEIRRRNLKVKIYTGMEIMLVGDVLDRLLSGEYITINDTNYVLAEVPFEVSSSHIITKVNRFMDEGYRVVLAHPERYEVIKRNPDRVQEILATGCVLQLNTGSIAGVFGRECQRTAINLLDRGMAQLIATDAHDTRRRSHNMRDTMEVLKSRYTSEQIHLWTSENPSRVIKGMELLAVDDI